MIKMNVLPVRTFNRLKVNETLIDYEPSEPKIYEISGSSKLELKESGDVGVNIKVADDNSITVVMLCECAGNATIHVETEISMGKGAELTLIQADMGKGGGRLINSVRCSEDKDASVQLIQLFPARGDVYNDCNIGLNGNRSRLDIQVAYMGNREKKLDMNYVVNHIGKNTTGNIRADGVLKDKAFKTFKGTIDFKTGSSGSKGEEREKVLLLSDDIVNQSVPIILCTEEDVEGAHGAAIGSLDEDTLFYLKSRGLDEDEAKRLVIYGMFNSLLEKIGDEDISSRVEGFLEEAV
ncbi:MAG: SufD family Fe-S cluster assembly protein [Lachnospiraceae bacterium]|nr:SufD family Fe-S cluster assembly protein [Lachnospiraceae bacterium]